jgi:hypothetical protein
MKYRFSEDAPTDDEICDFVGSLEDLTSVVDNSSTQGLCFLAEGTTTNSDDPAAAKLVEGYTNRGGVLSDIFIHPAYIYDAYTEDIHHTWAGASALPGDGLEKTISGAPLIFEFNHGISNISDKNYFTRRYTAATVAACYAGYLKIARDMSGALYEQPNPSQKDVKEALDSYSEITKQISMVADETAEALDGLSLQIQSAFLPRGVAIRRSSSQSSLFQSEKDRQLAYELRDFVRDDELLRRNIALLQGARDAMRSLAFPRRRVLRSETFTTEIKQSRRDAALAEIDLFHEEAMRK